MPDWKADVLPGYWQHTMTLGTDPDGEGELVATLVRRGEPDPSATRAVLLVHGFTDYFFNTELADHFARRGFAFYAVDLHKCGRSWREGQTPHFTTDLARYDVELERALDIIGSVSPAEVMVYGHSAGGLIVSLWLDRLHGRGLTERKRVNGLVLNSPWLDLQGPFLASRTHACRAGRLLAGRASGWWCADRARVDTARHCTATITATSTTT